NQEISTSEETSTIKLSNSSEVINIDDNSTTELLPSKTEEPETTDLDDTMAATPTSIQERLQLKRVPLDDWSIREKLGLASAVLCSGDQNWMSVSRALKSFGDTTRPADWFSQKSCAAQYGKLLENVETPKRKKRTLSERDSSTPVETPGESIVRKLTQERITELQKIMLEEQQEFQKLRDEIVLLQSTHVTEAQIREMAAQIEEEKRQQEIEKANHAEWLRKREQRKIEIERAWRPGLIYKNAALLKQQQVAAQQQQQQQQKSTNEQESMDTDDQDGSRSSSGQSPLLTSLLKSPSTTPNLSLLQQSTVQTVATPSVTMSESFVQSSTTSSLTPVSASQSAPTLSMLLDGGKSSGNIASKTIQHMDTQSIQLQDTSHDESIDIFPEQIPSVESTDMNDAKDDEQLMEVFKGLIPDNIEELADILTENNALLNPELLEEEEILEEVMNQEEAQQQEAELQLQEQDINKMDTFDQLKHETMLEERSKREAAALKALVEESSSTSITNVSPDDSNQEDDLPLKVLQKDIQEANKAKQAQEQTFQ
uniref:CSON012322 protein n=1 Tax=Culicoides sonorensis TaxID=179676 RepID=A0A336KLD8_CULSO